MTKSEIIVKMGITLFNAGFGYTVWNTELLESVKVGAVVIVLIVAVLVWTQKWAQKSKASE